MSKRCLALVASCLLCLSLSPVARAQSVPAAPIPQDPRDPASVEDFIGAPARPKPLKSFEVPQHPFMAANGDSNIHDDAYQTDAYDRMGPLGKDMTVTSTFHVADCASVTFDTKGRIVTICMGVDGPRLVMMDPVTLDTLAFHPLPPRSGAGTGTGIFTDFSGGGYFYLDDQDRAVVPTNNRQIWLIGSNDTTFQIERTYDLSAAVPVGDNLVSVLPDWSGNYWFITAKGLVGTVQRDTGVVATRAFEGEINANSFAVDDSGGVFIVSDHALYRFDAGEDGEPEVTWRTEYDRGSRLKPGQASQGSGTTPTVIGERYVAITDNADPRMNVLVYERNGPDAGSLLCKEPVFAPDAGNTDQSLIAVGNSLVVENNYGYSGPTSTFQGGTTTPGLTRVSFGRKGCRTVWESDEIAPSVVPKVSLANGLLYTYTKPPDEEADPWYLTAIDFRTGETVYKKLAGTGLGYNNNYAPVTIGPDGSAYVGALGGLIRLSDATPPEQAEGTRSCALPAEGEWEEAPPREVNVDPQKLEAALDFERPRMTQEIAVFRHGCLIGERRWFTGEGEHFEGWSMSKSATAMAAGRAISLGLLDIDDSVGKFVPEADAEHAAITVRDLLTMTSGLHWNLWRDYNIAMKDRVKDALSLPFDHEPGTFFEYGESPVALLAKVVGNAAGEDFQDFVQRELMGPIGMGRDDWSWTRDRAGNTEGYRGLNTTVDNFSRLGHLMMRNGRWKGTAVLDEGWVRDAVEPSSTNPGYGYMFWLNESDSYIAPTVYSRDERDHRPIESAPHDMYFMAGIQQQRTWVIPSLDMVVVRVGGSGDRDPDTRSSVFTSSYGENEHEFFRLLMDAVMDADIEDPGPYENGSPVPPLDPEYGIVKSSTEPDDMIAGFGGP